MYHSHRSKGWCGSCTSGLANKSIMGERFTVIINKEIHNNVRCAVVAVWTNWIWSVRGCILVSLKSHLRANRPNPNNIGLDGSCVRWMKTEDFIQAVAVPLSR